MKATADAVQVQAQNSITLAQIWEPQMQHMSCRSAEQSTQQGAGLWCLSGGSGSEDGAMLEMKQRPTQGAANQRRQRRRPPGEGRASGGGARPWGAVNRLRRRPPQGSRETTTATPRPGEPRTGCSGARPRA